MSLNNLNLNILFVLFTKPKHKLKVVDDLLKIGIESYFPTIYSNRIWSDRIKKNNEVLIKLTLKK